MTNDSIRRGAIRPLNLISWSKNGFIAYANNNGSHNLHMSYLENTDGRQWQIAPPQSLELRSDNTHMPELALVEWSNLSTDLAVADIYGNFYVMLAGVGLLDAAKSAAQTTQNETNAAQSPSYELTSYNHMELIFRDLVDENPVQHVATDRKIVAFKWLDIEKPHIVNKPATLVEGQSPSYAYTVGQHQPHGVTHPILTKQAAFALRENGTLDLFYQGEHKVEYHKISTQIKRDQENSEPNGTEGANGTNGPVNGTESAGNPDGSKVNGSGAPFLLTHALIGFSNDKTVIVVAYDAVCSKILVYTVKIDWGFLVESAKKQKVDPHYHTPSDQQKPPSLTVTKVQAVLPLSTVTSFVDDEDDSETIYTHSLASLDVVSASGDADSKPDIFISYITTTPSGTYSTLYRYHLEPELEIVSDAFSELGMRKNVAVVPHEPPAQALVIRDKLVRPGVMHSLSSALAESFFVVQYTTGRVDIIERSSMKVVNNGKDHKTGIKEDQNKDSHRSEREEDGLPKTVSSIFDVGFEFPKVDGLGPLPVLAVSPNLASLVYLDPLCTQLRVNVAENQLTKVSSRELLLTSVGFAFRHAYACYTNTCCDDLVVLMEKELSRVYRLLVADTKRPKVELIMQKFVDSVLCESHKAINFQLDAFSKESVDKLLSNPPLQKLLSLQMILGDVLREFFPGNNIVDIAWIVLNVRSASFGIMFLLSSMYRQISKKKPTEDNMQDSSTRGECIVSLVGNIKWLIDLMVYLNQELLQLQIEKKNPGLSKLTMKNSLVLPLILSKVPRLFLMYALSLINKTHEILKKLHKDLVESNKLFTPMKESLNRCFTILNNSPLTLSLFENYLKECDALVQREIASRLAYKEKGLSLRNEQKLVCQGDLNDDMLQIAHTLVDRHSATINRDLKVSELYFYDTTWLNIGVNQKIQKRYDGPIMNIGSYLKVIPRVLSLDGTSVDALRKILVFPGNGMEKIPLRQCTRCRSVSLLSDMQVFEVPNTVGLWTMVFQRACICGNPWVRFGENKKDRGTA